MDDFEFDEIGYWSEIKLDIIREYATAYSTILAGQRTPPLQHIYVDGFAGAGRHRARDSGDIVEGSPAIALSIVPPFREYHFIDLDGRKAAALEGLATGRKDVSVYHGDCNRVLLEEILPRTQYKDYRRALCVLDPYGLHLDWKVVSAVAHAKTVEVFLNFPVADINRNVLWKNPEAVSATQRSRLSRFWGDDTWKVAAYKPARQVGLFGLDSDEKASNDEIAEAFRSRLETVAGFAHVPSPIPMRNSKNAVVYYLYFASHKPVAAKIVRQIFDKYRDRRA